jgi:uncharacterized protein (TIGR00255 family)
MTVSSMTGFARASSRNGTATWQWDIRSVNGKSLELRFRLPPGLEHLEAAARNILSAIFKRGNMQVSLTFEDHSSGQGIVVDEKALDEAIAVAQRFRKLLGGGPPNVEELMGLRGVVEVVSRPLPEEFATERDANVLATLSEAAHQLKKSRDAEGEKIASVLASAVNRIETLVVQAVDNPARKPEAIRAKLKEQVDRLIDASSTFDPVRLHQEAMLLATKFDVQEEVDRLQAHVGAARELLLRDEAVGRKLDFLAQEFNREANTLCSKSNDIGLTSTGLELKNTIDQFREQLQNIE